MTVLQNTIEKLPFKYFILEDGELMDRMLGPSELTYQQALGLLGNTTMIRVVLNERFVSVPSADGDCTSIFEQAHRALISGLPNSVFTTDWEVVP